MSRRTVFVVALYASASLVGCGGSWRNIAQNLANGRESGTRQTDLPANMPAAPHPSEVEGEQPAAVQGIPLTTWTPAEPFYPTQVQPGTPEAAEFLQRSTAVVIVDAAIRAYAGAHLRLPESLADLEETGLLAWAPVAANGTILSYSEQADLPGTVYLKFDGPDHFMRLVRPDGSKHPGWASGNMLDLVGLDYFAMAEAATSVAALTQAFPNDRLSVEADGHEPYPDQGYLGMQQHLRVSRNVSDHVVEQESTLLLSLFRWYCKTYGEFPESYEQLLAGLHLTETQPHQTTAESGWLPGEAGVRVEVAASDHLVRITQKPTIPLVEADTYLFSFDHQKGSVRSRSIREAAPSPERTWVTFYDIVLAPE
ncbi:MAG: hypothetical protein ABI743_12130 [bacterium]